MSSPPIHETIPNRIRVLKRVINGGELSDEHTFDLLLGMDVLTTGDLQIGKDGTFKFEF